MTGIAIKPGVALKPGSALQSFPRLMLSLDAATYDSVTTPGAQALGTGTSSGFFRVYGPLHTERYDRIQPGWTVVDHPTWVVVSNTADASDNNESCTIVISGGSFVTGQYYAFTSANTWYDSIAQRPFLLHNGVSYDSDNGGSLVFSTANHQYADTPNSLDALPRWSIEAWYYYDGTNTSGSPCIVTEVYNGGYINYALGNCNDSSPDIQVGNWDGGNWHRTADGIQLTAGNWYHLVGVHDGKHHKLYINNSLVSTVPAPSLGQSSNAGIRLMNRWDTGDAQLVGGKLAIVNIYNGDVGAAGVTTKWNATKERFGFVSGITSSSGDWGNYGHQGVDATDTTGFTVTSYTLNLYAFYSLSNATGNAYDRIQAAWTAASLDPNFAYAWNATFASYTPPGGGLQTNYSCLVRMSIGGGQIKIIPIDQTDTSWQTGSFTSTALQGTFSLPLTLSAYTPAVPVGHNYDWEC